ncbi:MAG: hypothetical protein WBG90_13430 [Saonia sp.]
MKTRIPLLLAIFIWIPFCNVLAWQANSLETKDAATQISYQITIAESDPHVAKVVMTFVPQDSLIYMAQGANNMDNRWATFVHDMKATDTTGKEIPLKKMPDALWILSTTTKEKIVLSYTVRLDHEDYEWSGGLDGVAYTTEWGVFYTGRALLVFNGNDWEQITVHFKLPKTWRVTTPWKEISGKEHFFEVNNQSALMQSMIFAGTHEELSFKKDGFELIFALGGEEVVQEREDYENLASGVLEYYIELMGGLPNPAPDNVLDKSVVIINAADTTDGEVIGNNISILIKKGGDAMSKMISRFIFAHEFFHLWNGKSFLPDDLETEWFKEGFSNYYTLKALYHIGFLDETAYFGVLNDLFFQRYTNDTGVGSLSMIQGGEKHAHWGLIYGGGLFVAIAQDIMIRKATGNTKSVDDLMRKFYKRYGGTHDHYVIDDLEDSLSELNGKDQSEFFDTYIRGSERIPIDTYLHKAGLKAMIEEGQLRIAPKEGATAVQKKMVEGLLGIRDL